MSAVGDIIGSIMIFAGAFFFLVGAIGIYRMPDVFTRMHAAGISDTVGAGLLLGGMMFLSGFSFFVTVKLVIIFGIIFFTSPIATHALAQATLHEGIKPMGVGRTVLAGPGVQEEPEPASAAKTRSAPGASGKGARKPKTRSAKRKTTGGTASRSTRRTRS